MLDPLGYIAIALLCLMSIFLALKYPPISKIIIFALIIRLIFLIINNNIFYLPDGDMDSLNFEKRAWDWSQEGFLKVFNHYKGPDTYFLSFLIAIPYSLFGRSILMAHSFSIFFGIASVFLGWLAAKKLWDDRTAIKIGWMIAIFPSLVSYSVLTMREVYITFFLLLAFYGIINWVRQRSYNSIILTVVGFVSATFFHGASIIGLFIFFLILFLDGFKESLKLLLVKRINFKFLVVISLSSVILITYVTSNISIPYLGNFQEMGNTETLENVINFRTKGDAAYPEWTKINSNIEYFYKLPIRSIYFLFSPFPWDVKKISHLVGLFDSLLYITLAFLIFLNLKAILKDPTLKIILLILICYFIIFGVGVSNFGTGIRHRSKFLIELILLAGPLIPKLSFSKIKLKRSIKFIFK